MKFLEQGTAISFNNNPKYSTLRCMKTLEDKEKLLVTSILSCSLNDFLNRINKLSNVFLFVCSRNIWTQLSMNSVQHAFGRAMIL